MPILWMANEKLRATGGGIFNNSVNTGYEIAALPSGLEPAMNEPKTIVNAAAHRRARKLMSASDVIYHIQLLNTLTRNRRYKIGIRRAGRSVVDMAGFRTGQQ